MKYRSTLVLLVLLLTFVALFGVAQSAYAEIKATASFYVWDDTSLVYKNSTVDLYLDGTETDVLHEVGVDTKAYDPVTIGQSNPTGAVCAKVAALQASQPAAWRANCPAAQGDNSDKFTGVMELGIPRQDNDSLAYAFAYSEDWSLIDCDLNNSGAWNGTDLTYNTLTFPPAPPPTGGTTRPKLLPAWDIVNNNAAAAPFFKILAIDAVSNCTTGNCLTELVTTIYINFDTNNDGAFTVADGVPVAPSGGLTSGRTCFFARVYPIHYYYTNVGSPPSPGLDPRTVNPNPGAVWTGNPQARISAGGGDKTVNFNLFGPTAITLEQLVAQSPGGVHPAIWLAIFVLITAIGIVLIRESRQQKANRLVRHDD